MYFLSIQKLPFIIPFGEIINYPYYPHKYTAEKLVYRTKWTACYTYKSDIIYRGHPNNEQELT
jgi:hypothetical protein